MFTIIITLLLPLVSIGIWRQSILKNNKKSGQLCHDREGRICPSLSYLPALYAGHSLDPVVADRQ